MNLEKLYVVSWSPSQRCVDIDTYEGWKNHVIVQGLSNLIENSISKEKGNSDYMILGVFETRDEAQPLIDKIKECRNLIVEQEIVDNTEVT